MAQIELQKELEEELESKPADESHPIHIESDSEEPKEIEIIPKNSIRILSVHELIVLFSQECPFTTKQQTIGFVGYPNANKSKN